MFCTCTRPCARANDAKIVRSRDAQCDTMELPLGNSLEIVLLSNLFLKLGVINIYDMNIKKIKKKMGSPCLFTRQRALKMGYFY